MVPGIVHTQQFQERRTFERFAVLWTVRHHGARCAQEEGRALDASANGIMFLSRRRYMEGDMVALEIGVGRMRFFRCTAKVARVLDGPQDQWRTGVRFEQMTALDRLILREALEDASPSPASAAAPLPTSPEDNRGW